MLALKLGHARDQPAHREGRDRDTASTPRASARLRTRCEASASLSSAGPAAASSSLPACVGTALRLVRRNSAAPSQSSNARICRLTAPWVTFSSSAACEKLPSRAAASKALMALSGGRRMSCCEFSSHRLSDTSRLSSDRHKLQMAATNAIDTAAPAMTLLSPAMPPPTRRAAIGCGFS